MPDENQIIQSGKLSVQTQRGSYFWGDTLSLTGGYQDYANSLPSVYNSRRQRILAQIDTHPQNNLWAGAIGKIIHKVAGTSAEISGKRRVGWYQDVIMFNADQGGGLGQFVAKVLRDYFRFDDGAVIEVIGRGDPTSYLKREAVVGIRVLDPLRCYFTDDAEFPVWYQDSVTGQLHKMHFTRVYRMVDNPFSDPELHGRGYCALSRALGFVQQAIVNQAYVGQSLSDEMPPGILLVNGVTAAKWDEVWALYKSALKRDGITSYRPMIEYVSQGETVTIEFKPFAIAPTGLDNVELTELHARGIALGLDIDPQDVLPLQGGSFGTNTQAKVLDRKNQDGGFTHLLKLFERFFNDRVLPDPLRFEWVYRDSEQSLQAADIASKHMVIAKDLVSLSSLSNGALSAQKLGDAAILYLADSVPALGDIFRDEDGEMISLYDDDPSEEIPEAQQIATDINADVAPTDEGVQTATESKDYEDTRLKFTREFARVLIDSNDGEINRRRSGIILRSIMARDGRQSTLDGLEAGGVDAGALIDEDQSIYTKTLAEQSSYITDLTARVYSTNGLSEAQIYASVEAFANKSLQAFYYNGLESADSNGMYQFAGSDGAESCSTCKRLKGQKHRLKEWKKRQMRPGVDTNNFDCGGWQCEHYLQRTEGRSNGRF